MKIGYYTTYLPYMKPPEKPVRIFPGGGMEVVALQLALHMAQRGHEVTVFTTSEEAHDREERYENVSVYRYRPDFTIASAPFSLKMFSKPLKHDFDIIHAHLAAPTAALAGLWHAKRKRIPFVVGYSGDLDPGFGNLLRRVCTLGYITFLQGKLLSSAEAIIPPTQCYVENSKFLPKYRHKTTAVHHGINLKDFNLPLSKEACRQKLGLPADSNIILFVGWLSRRKGPDILMKAMAEITKRVPNTEVVFMGTGELQGELERMTKELSLERHVRFPGYIKDAAQKALYYHSADIFTLPSPMTTESFGIVNLEAMACGLPIVASNIGGIPDVVKDGKNGFLVPPGEPYALAEAIVRLLTDPALWERMSQEGRVMVKSFTWPKIAEDTERIYTSLVSTNE